MAAIRHPQQTPGEKTGIKGERVAAADEHGSRRPQVEV
jgi:hypothetical protein